jgi:guanylate kinase
MAEVPLGRLVVVSGPSGAGKTTVLRQVFACSPVPLVRSVSATTRAPRPGEVDGQSYFFLDPADFQARRARGEFLECFEVFGEGHWYGTPQSAVAAGLKAGKWVLLEIDVQGAMAVVQRYPDAITVFLRPPSLEVLEVRLRGRRTESEEAIQRRLAQARRELALADRYAYRVVNEEGNEQRAAQEICEILKCQGRSDGYA